LSEKLQGGWYQKSFGKYAAASAGVPALEDDNSIFQSKKASNP